MPSDTAGRTTANGDVIDKIKGVFDQIGNFWQRVTEGLEVQALWTQFTAEARASYSLYTREVDWEALQGETRFRRFFKLSRTLFWAMLLKLSPARRVFLLLALFFAVLAITRSQVIVIDGRAGGGVPNNLPFVLLSVGALVFLLALELADRVTMKRDLEIAREIQRWLVPEVPPKVPGVDLAFSSRPANTVGGDYYDAFLLNQDGQGPETNRLMLVVADVAGKSVPAALLMATFQASLRSLATAPTSLDELVNHINTYACEHSLGGRRFTTAFFAELDTATRSLTYIRAGHNAPILKRASGKIEHLDAGDMPLGIDKGVRYASTSTTVGAGDLLVIFTDGVIEAVNEVDQEFGERRLLEVVQVAPVESAENTLKRIVAAVDAFAGSTRQYDDLTCLILRAA